MWFWLECAPFAHCVRVRGRYRDEHGFDAVGLRDPVQGVWVVVDFFGFCDVVEWVY